MFLSRVGLLVMLTVAIAIDNVASTNGKTSSNPLKAKATIPKKTTTIKTDTAASSSNARLALSILPSPCYTYLGCFPMGEPWFSLLRPLPPPQSPDIIDTRFLVFTRASSDAYNVTKLPNIVMTGSTYVGSKSTFFITHGFAGSINVPWAINLKNALLKEFDCNVIMIDWAKGSNQVNYLQVASNIRVVAAEIIRFAKFLMVSNGASASRFHLLGLSLGAHAMGLVGKAIPGIKRISAFDAAQPFFEGFSPLVRVVKTDAEFVQAIHTNSRPFIPTGGLGFMAPFGHVDFYINGGADQPGCELPANPPITSLQSLTTTSLDVLKKWSFCDHLRATLLFTASINVKATCTFWGHVGSYSEIFTSLASGGQLTQLMNLTACTTTTCTPVGLQTPGYSARGCFLVKTTGSEPYCISEPIEDATMAALNVPAAVI